MVQHFRQEARRVGTPTEPEEDDIVSGRVVAHKKLIAADHVLVEGGTVENISQR